MFLSGHLWPAVCNCDRPIAPTNRCPRLVLSGEPGLTYAIQRSTNLLNWVTLTNLLNTDGTFEFIDGPATDGQRF